MADAKKCDICKTFYEPDTKVYIPKGQRLSRSKQESKSDWTIITFDIWAYNHYQNCPVRVIDVCLECTREQIKYLARDYRVEI